MYAMDAYRARETELVCIGRDDLRDLVRSKVAVVQLTAGAPGGDILRVEPHKISHAVARGWGA